MSRAITSGSCRASRGGGRRSRRPMPTPFLLTLWTSRSPTKSTARPGSGAGYGTFSGPTMTTTWYVSAHRAGRIAHDPLCEIGCPYVVRGFDYDYVGILWLNDLAWRGHRWHVDPHAVEETGFMTLTRAARREARRMAPDSDGSTARACDPSVPRPAHPRPQGSVCLGPRHGDSSTPGFSDRVGVTPDPARCCPPAPSVPHRPAAPHRPSSPYLARRYRAHRSAVSNLRESLERKVESRTLAALRDTLLPRLISGELR